MMDGKTTDRGETMRANDDQMIPLSWGWRSDKPTRLAGIAALMQKPRLGATAPVWDRQLALRGGFTPILDIGHA